MRETGGVCAGDGPKPMGGGIGAMTYAGPTPVVGAMDPFPGSGTTAVAWVWRGLASDDEGGGELLEWEGRR